MSNKQPNPLKVRLGFKVGEDGETELHIFLLEARPNAKPFEPNSHIKNAYAVIIEPLTDNHSMDGFIPYDYEIPQDDHLAISWEIANDVA